MSPKQSAIRPIIATDGIRVYLQVMYPIPKLEVRNDFDILRAWDDFITADGRQNQDRSRFQVTFVRAGHPENRAV